LQWHDGSLSLNLRDFTPLPYHPPCSTLFLGVKAATKEELEKRITEFNEVLSEQLSEAKGTPGVKDANGNVTTAEKKPDGKGKKGKDDYTKYNDKFILHFANAEISKEPESHATGHPRP